MLTYDMKERGKVPAYKYLYSCIKEDILNGNLLPDEKLPSKRSFATHLDVSVVTVMSAYEQLISEGYIYSEPKKGYFVVPILAQRKTEFPEISNYKEEKPLRFDFSGNRLSGANFPFSVWSRLMRKVLLDYENELLNPLPYNGAEILRKAICQYLYHSSGMNVSPQQVIIGAGTEYLYMLITQLVGKDKILAVENPGYSKISKIYRMNGIKTRYVGVDSKGLSAEALRKSNADVVHISPSHHYPTGVVMPVDRQREILNWADERGGYIIEDDYDSEFRGFSQTNTLFNTDKNERVIYLNTFSKTIAPSMRISYLILPSHLLEVYREKLNFLSCTVPSFEQYTLAMFINEGYFERHISRMKKHYQQCKAIVGNIIKNSAVGDKAEIVENVSGLHFIMKISTEKTDDEVVSALKERGIGAKFLSQYMQNDTTGFQHQMIVNYGGFEIDKLKDALKVLKEVI